MAKKTLTKKKTSGLAANVNDIQSILSKQFGDVIIHAPDLGSLQGRIINTTLSLDMSLSGGMPEGIVTNISGAPKCGKTTLALTMASECQKAGKHVYYFDVEGRLRTDLLECIEGLDLDMLDIIRSTEDNILSAEDYINAATLILKNKEKQDSLIIFDSVAALCPADTLSNMAGDSKRMAGVPALLYDFFRKTAAILPVTKGNIITLTHLQANPSPYGGPVEVGGNAIQYFASIRLKCFSSPEVPKTGFPKIGKDSVFKVTASALGAPSCDATVFVRYGHGCDKYEDLVHVALELGLIEQKGSWFVYNEEKYQGRDNLILCLKTDSDFFDSLDNEVRSMVFN